MSTDKQYVPLFGRNDDMRVKLLVNELREQSNNTRGSGPHRYVAGPTTTIQIKTLTKIFHNGLFKTPDVGVADLAIHSEWVAFASHFSNRLGGKALSTDALKVIQGLKGTALTGSEQEFGQQLVLAVVAEIKAGSTNITNSPSQWDRADSAKYHPSTALAFLFSNKTTSGVDTLHNAAKGASTADDTKVKEFNYQFDKYWLRTMLEAHAASATQPVAPSRFFDEESPASSEVYYRRGSELYTRDASGAEVRVDTGSPAFKSLTVDNKCLGTGLDSSFTGAATCADYLRDCLSGKDVTKCKTYLDDEKYWEKAVNEVDAMLPAIAVQTLNAFEFGMEQVWDNTASRRLLKYKNTDAWIAGLVEATKGRTGALAATDVEKIAKNTKLIGYLNMLVKKVNSNPAILNKDYTGATDSARINDPDAFAGSRLHKMGVKARLAAPTLSVSSIDKLANGIKDANARIGITIGYPGLYGFATKLNLMSGGGAVEDLETKVSDVTKQTGHIIQSHFLALHTRLQKYGKEIEKSDHDKILNLIESLKKAEEKLYKAQLYTEKYARLLEVHGEKDATSVLSMDHLKQFVDNRNKYFTRVSKKQNDLLSILRSIAEAANKEAPATEAEMKAINVDAKTVNFNALLG